jgi:8-oxo-dGTP pyrophosphatase MutT (NUDIX family)
MADAFDYTKLPAKQMAAGALIRDVRGNILIVKPTYRPEWLVPGGSIERDESPYACVAREVEEELSVSVQIGRVLCVEYQSQSEKRPENLRFIFDGGVMHDAVIAQIGLPAAELSEYRFVPLADALTLLAAKLNRRIELSVQALREGGTVYAEDGVLV